MSAVAERHPTTSVALHAVVGPFVPPFMLAFMLHSYLGPLGTVPVFAWVLYQAVAYKRALLRALPADSGPSNAALPPWFDESTLASIEADLARHGMKRVALSAQGDAAVLGVATGLGPTTVVIAQPAPSAHGPVIPSVVFVTWFDDVRLVTSGLTFNVLSWLVRGRRFVHDVRPGGTVDDLLARHRTDVVALGALVRPPDGPGSAERYLADVAESWPRLRAKVRRVPAPWLLACAWWFAAPRPVRLRGPLPA